MSSSIAAWLGLVVMLAILGWQVRKLARQWRKLGEPVRVTRRQTPFGTRTAWQRFYLGALVTLIVPGIFTVLILVMYVFGGRYQTDRGSTTDMLRLSICYPIGSALIGAIGGLGYPLMRSLIGAPLVGTVAVTPMVLGIIASADSGNPHIVADNAVIAAFMIGFFGLCGGLAVRRRLLAPTNSSSTPTL